MLLRNIDQRLRPPVVTKWYHTDVLSTEW